MTHPALSHQGIERSLARLDRVGLLQFDRDIPIQTVRHRVWAQHLISDEDEVERADRELARLRVRLRTWSLRRWLRRLVRTASEYVRRLIERPRE